jgi:NADH dehydrogenase FAD-containing subunit
MAENLVNKGLDVTIVEATPQVLPPFDPELAILIADELVAHGACVETGTSIASVQDDTVTMADGRDRVARQSRLSVDHPGRQSGNHCHDAGPRLEAADNHL